MTPAQRLDRAVLAVCDIFGVSRAQLLHSPRRSSVMVARKHLYLAASVTMPVSITQIARMLHRDHTTLLKVIKRFKAGMTPGSQDEQLHKLVLERIYQQTAREAA